MKEAYQTKAYFIAILAVLSFLSGCRKEKTAADFTKLKALPTSKMKLVTHKELKFSIQIPFAGKLEKNLHQSFAKPGKNIEKLTMFFPKKAQQSLKKNLKQAKKELKQALKQMALFTFPNSQGTINITSTMAPPTKKGRPIHEDKDNVILFHQRSQGQETTVYYSKFISFLVPIYHVTTAIKKGKQRVYCLASTPVFANLKTFQKACESIKVLEKPTTKKTNKPVKSI